MAQTRRKLTELPLSTKPSSRTINRANTAPADDPLVGIACRIPLSDRMKLREIALAKRTTYQALVEQAIFDLIKRES